MDYPKVFSYLSQLNNNDAELFKFYNNILSFESVHFIPAVSFDVAKFLTFFSELKKPKEILEIGFGSGASSLFIAKGIGKIDRFISLEKDKNRHARGLKLLEHYNNRDINLIHSDALDYLNNDDIGNFDFIFLDAIKREYYKYIKLIKPCLSKNGILICDNILFGGKVVKNDFAEKYKNGVKYLKLFNDMMKNNESFFSYFFPIGDGLLVSIKK